MTQHRRQASLRWCQRLGEVLVADHPYTETSGRHDLATRAAVDGRHESGCRLRYGYRDAETGAFSTGLPLCLSLNHRSEPTPFSRSDLEAIVLNACRDAGGAAVIDKMLELMVPAAALLWLEGNDAHLGGARPIVVLKLEGSKPVLDALHAFEEGAFA
jgi:hypothetical protein